VHVSFQDLDELLGSPKKELPVRGRLLSFPDRISAESGVVLLRVSQRAKSDPEQAKDADAIVADLLTPEGWEALQAEVLGKPAEEFIADGLSGDEVAHIFKTLMTWHLYGQDAAEKAWVQVGNPPAPNRAARRASKAPAKSNRTRGSHAGSQTPASASAPAAASPGPASSSSGG
jgi:hypothetical protein